MSGLVASKDIEGLGGARAPLVAPVEPVWSLCGACVWGHSDYAAHQPLKQRDSSSRRRVPCEVTLTTSERE